MDEIVYISKIFGSLLNTRSHLGLEGMDGLAKGGRKPLLRGFG